LRFAVFGIICFLFGGVVLSDELRIDTISDTLKEMSQALSKHELVTSVEIDEDSETVIIFGDGFRVDAAADNLFLKLQKSNSLENTESVFAEHIASILATVERTPKGREGFASGDLPKLRTLLRHKDFGLHLKGTENELFTKHFVGDLAIFLILDQVSELSYLKLSEISQSELGEQALIERGLENLPDGVQIIDVGQHMKAVVYHGTYNASLLLDEAFWAARFEDQDEFYVIAPDNGSVAFTKDLSSEAFSEINSIRKRLYGSEPYPLSEYVYLRTKDGWEIAE